MVTGSSTLHSTHVASTVVSVGPYVLITRRPGYCQRRITSGGQASPPEITIRTEGISVGKIDKNVGTIEINVHWCSLIYLTTSSGTRTTSGGDTTRAPPFVNAIQSSSTDASNPSEKP